MEIAQNWLSQAPEDHGVWIKLFLTPLSYLFAALTRLRRWAYRAGLLKRVKLPGTVISVGNIALGGTGKSPTVSFLAGYFSSQQKTVAILTRGYKSSLASREWCVLRAGRIERASPGVKGLVCDEPWMLSAQNPEVAIVVGRHRGNAARGFLQGGKPVDIWLLDDGFQHLAVHRDLDIVLRSRQELFESHWVLPRGAFREPVSALKHADLVVETGSINSRAIGFKISRFSDPLRQTLFSCDWIKTQKLACVCAIAAPERFLNSLSQALGEISCERYFCLDHRVLELDRLQELVSEGYFILTTEKDFYRQKEDFASLGVGHFGVASLTVEGGDWLLESVEARLSS